MLDVLPLALVSAVFPTLLAAVVVILGLPSPGRILLVYLSGALLMSVVAGLAWVHVFSAGWVIDASDPSVNASADIAGAVIALGFLGLLLRGRERFLPRPRRNWRSDTDDEAGSWSRRGLATGPLKLVFVIGLVLAIPGPIYLLALKDIAAADQPVVADVAAVVGYTLIKFAFAEAPLVGYVLAPEQTRDVVGRLNRWFGGRNTEIAAALCAAVAAILIAHSIATV
jgi:Sap, sulfolipid-1-addressing protein